LLRPEDVARYFLAQIVMAYVYNKIGKVKLDNIAAVTGLDG